MSVFSKLRSTLRPGRLHNDLDDELQFHIDRRADELIAQGVPADEARREATRRFGNRTLLKETARDRDVLVWLETALQDTRYAFRTLRRNPGFAATAILSLALAIGANTAIYSIVDAAILRPLPVPEPDRLFTLATPKFQKARVDLPPEDESFSYPVYQQFQAAAGASARLALFSYAAPIEVQIPDTGAPIEHAFRQFVSGDAFEILKVPPALGRVFSIDDDRIPWGHPVVVISHDYWQRRFHADPHIVGQRIQIWGKSYSVIGVARQGFFGVEPGMFVDVWQPAMMFSKPAFTDATWTWFRIIGRIEPGRTESGTTRTQLQARLQPLLRAYGEALIEQFPTIPPAMQKQIRERPLLMHPGAAGTSDFRRSFARPLWIVFGVGVGILLIACANVASLLLARSTARSAEMAMRVSIGAGRSRLVRQLLTESLLLSLIAGGVGWALARVAAPAMVAMLSTDAVPVRFALEMDTRILFFCAAVSTIAALFFGLLPAWQASGAQPMLALRGLRAQAGKLRMGRFFVGIQVAFAFMLIIAGASFLFSLRNLLKVDTGFDAHNVAVFTVVTTLSDMTQTKELNVFLDQFQRRIEALAGVQSAATAQYPLFDGAHARTQVILPGRPLPETEVVVAISPRYFAAMRTPLLAGRDFEPRDREERAPGQPRLNIVNVAFARKYFGDENPIGKTFQAPEDDGKTLLKHQIIGVVANSHFGSLRSGPEPLAYSIFRDSNLVALYVRSELDLGSIVRMVEREALAMGSGTRIRKVTTLEMQIGNTLLKEKLLAAIGGAFAILGLLLAAIGLFGLLNYTVTRRTKEIGIRAALGARPPALVLLVLKDVLSMIAVGLIIGLAGSLALMSLVRALLFGIRPFDPLVVTTAAAVFIASALIAGGLPASRAARIDPMSALRCD